MTNISCLGSYLNIDKSGYLINDSDFIKVVSPWFEPLEAVKRAYLRHFGKEVHSIYIRGSVARGMAIENLSDLDVFAILFDNPQKISFQEFVIEKKFIEKKFKFLTGIDTAIFSYNQFFSHESMCSNSVLIKNCHFVVKTQSACIYGENIAEKLPKYKADLNAISCLYVNIREVNKTVLYKTKGLVSDEEIKYWCSWLMKIYLRTSFLLVMEAENTYTRDLYLCYSSFSKIFSNKEKEIRKVLELALNPTANIHELINLMGGVGEWLYHQIEDLFSRIETLTHTHCSK